jgi:hypothetical protein
MSETFFCEYNSSTKTARKYYLRWITAFSHQKHLHNVESSVAAASAGASQNRLTHLSGRARVFLRCAKVLSSVRAGSRGVS